MNCIIRKGKKQTRSVTRKRKKWLNNKIIEIEESHKKNEVRKFFKDLKFFSQGQVIIPSMCKDTEGNLVTQIDQVLRHWKDYFCELLHVNDEQSIQTLLVSEDESHITQEISPPTFNEVCYIINKLKTNKAAGSDNITAELIKCGGRTPNTDYTN